MREALKWYEMAANQGHPKALVNLGYFYEHGIEVDKDVERALSYYRSAAEKGLPSAMCICANFYELGYVCLVMVCMPSTCKFFMFLELKPLFSAVHRLFPNPSHWQDWLQPKPNNGTQVV